MGSKACKLDYDGVECGCVWGCCIRDERIADLELKLAEAREEISYHANEWLCAKVAFEIGESRHLRAKENAERAAEWYKDTEKEDE